MPMRVTLNSGKNFIDQNGHHMKKLTLLPLIKAIQDMADQGATLKFDWPSVDFVTDHGRLRKLLAWAAGLSDQWRIDTHTGDKGWCPGPVHHEYITRKWTKY